MDETDFSMAFDNVSLQHPALEAEREGVGEMDSYMGYTDGLKE